jgi:hypothetical protein
MNERLYSTSQVAELLGGLHPNAVLLLIKHKKLAAKRQNIRGESKCARLYVKASELNRYIRELPGADEMKQEPGKQRTSKRQRNDPEEAVTTYIK